MLRYEQWQRLRKTAKDNAHGKLPASFDEQEPTPPPPPVAEEEILDLTMDFNAISIDPEAELDESGVERVPMADPEMDVRFLCLIFHCKGRLSNSFSDHSLNKLEPTSPPHQTVLKICTFAGEARSQVWWS